MAWIGFAMLVFYLVVVGLTYLPRARYCRLTHPDQLRDLRDNLADAVRRAERDSVALQEARAKIATFADTEHEWEQRIDNLTATSNKY